MDAIGDARRVYVCPDGPLARLPFASVPGAEGGTFLVEELELVNLEDAADLGARGSRSRT